MEDDLRLHTQSRCLARTVAIGCVLTLAACGGGGSGDGGTGPGATATGYLIDAPVKGLSYTSGGQSGTTGTDGSFTYEVGNSISFNLGNVVLGSTGGTEYISPVHLQGENSVGVRTTNMVRFLMAIDSNGIPSDGITISPGVQAAATNWAALDFSLPTFDSTLGGAFADVQAIDNRTPVLPAALDAVTHLQQSTYCAYSGGFKGSFSGDSTGTLVFGIDARTGNVNGIALISGGGGQFIYTGNSSMSMESIPTFVTVGQLNPTTTITASGVLSSFNTMSGTWNGTGGISGTIQATRVGPPNASVRYRLGGAFTGNASGYFDMAVLEDGTTVTGTGFILDTNEVFSISGTFNGSALSASCTAGSACQITGTYTPATGTFTGNWSLSYQGTPMTGSFNGSGCTLR